MIRVKLGFACGKLLISLWYVLHFGDFISFLWILNDELDVLSLAPLPVVIMPYRLNMALRQSPFWYCYSWSGLFDAADHHLILKPLLALVVSLQFLFLSSSSSYWTRLFQCSSMSLALTWIPTCSRIWSCSRSSSSSPPRSTCSSTDSAQDILSTPTSDRSLVTTRSDEKECLIPSYSV